MIQVIQVKHSRRLVLLPLNRHIHNTLVIHTWDDQHTALSLPSSLHHAECMRMTTADTIPYFDIKFHVAVNETSRVKTTWMISLVPPACYKSKFKDLLDLSRDYQLAKPAKFQSHRALRLWWLSFCPGWGVENLSTSTFTRCFPPALKTRSHKQAVWPKHIGWRTPYVPWS